MNRESLEPSRVRQDNLPDVRPLLLVGAGGFGRETAEAVRAINVVRPTWHLLGFLDDEPDTHGSDVSGVRVLGGMEAIDVHPHAQIVLCPGRPDNYTTRLRLAERLGLEPHRYATIVHPTASIGATCDIGLGSVVLAHVDLTADVVLGQHVAVMPQVVLAHDVQVGDCATLASGVRLGGACRIGRGAYIGAGACLRERVSVGDWAMVGMGSVVTRDVPGKRMWFGVPARDRSGAPLPVEAEALQ